MRRFILADSIINDGKVTVSGDLFRHMAKVLRLKAGTSVILADGAGRECTGVITAVGAKSLEIRVEEGPAAPTGDNGPRITLYQGMPKGDKLEFIVQKCTELGVAEIVPFTAARSIAKVTHQRGMERIERWRRIATEAARQSKRRTVPQVTLAENLSEVLQAAQHSVKLLLWEEEQGNRLKETLSGLPIPESIAVLVGPEGGLTAEEAAAASACGFIPLSLGKRIVRTETAGIIILSILQFYWGDIG
ncbi:16S rRNA (uracil(1498)-N(3))-methyltransferase [Geotalea uraniireducens]|uniref:Ribosomal RNA small subunit methyltransferase E n=1 Tax=Geotalea uraniireducens (strain Rf4) TaxID=351605 RepID=A5G9G4_GEOUR|nr:16S rRNA (uracil(1498)-N(3))-methyltransferase [Geotalea uraniireducens]ABQ28432.1 protein of unknown function DUF558 [Geotalea uraniireducens Rf4]